MLTSIDKIVQFGSDLLNHFFPDKNKVEENKTEIRKLIEAGVLQIETQAHEERLQQVELNKIEAQSSSLFVSGWRPAAGWACVLGLIYSFLIYPVLIAFDLKAITLDNNTLMTLLFALLGLGGYRTFEKVKRHKNANTK